MNSSEQSLFIRDAIGVLVDVLPARTSLRQAYAFAVVAHAIDAGKRVQVRDLKEWTGCNAIANTFDIFLEIDGGLGWINQTNDTKDRRRKFLGLTPAGKDILNRMRKVK